jgi:hypothetical protein
VFGNQPYKNCISSLVKRTKSRVKWEYIDRTISAYSSFRRYKIYYLMNRWHWRHQISRTALRESFSKCAIFGTQGRPLRRERHTRKLFLECCTLRRLLECYWVFPECIWHSGKHASPVVPASCNLRPATHNHRCRHDFEMRLGSARHRCGWWGAMLSRVWCGHIPSLSALQHGHSHYHRLRLHPHCGRHRLDVRQCEGGFYHTMLEVLKEGGRRTSRDTAGSAAICEQERGKGCWR